MCAKKNNQNIVLSEVDGIKTPWFEYYGDIPQTLNYPEGTIFDQIKCIANQYPNSLAYNFLGTQVTFNQFVEKINECAKGYKAIGISQGDKVTICMPNTPQGVISFYALNLIGAVPNMVHPLSSEKEIEYFIDYSKSKAILILDAFYSKVENLKENCESLESVIVASIATELSYAKKMGFKLTKGRKIKKISPDADMITYTDLINKGKEYKGLYIVDGKADQVAAILYSGGTTGTMKGILLSNRNFNALALQTAALGQVLEPGDKFLSIMPIFHGFGLGIGIHTALIHGCTCYLVPQFSIETYAQLLKKIQPNFIAGVPTIYEALLRSKDMRKVDLSCLKGVFSGGDSLSIELKKKVDAFFIEHGANVQIREGYGLTECVTASCLTPKDYYREGSIGIPFPDTFYKIVRPSTKIEVPYGETGEICISGPSVMIGYLDNQQETEDTLQTHSDGRVWLHTGDMGVMDEDGFIYFKQRLKRMIISNGYSIYPSQLENVIDGHEKVLMSTVIGIPDEYKGQRVKAFVVLKNGVNLTEQVKDSIYKHCVSNISKYAMPTEFEYRDKLPQTLVGKVAFTVLEKEELAKLQEAKYKIKE